MQFTRTVTTISAITLAGALITSGLAPALSGGVPAAAPMAAQPADRPDGQDLKAGLKGSPAVPQGKGKKPSQKLRTPFEISNGAAWTTVLEARNFNKKLAAGNDRVRVDQIGKSGNGQPIQLISVGYPEPKPVSKAAKGSVVLFNCSIHGNEPSGREACLQLARDMSTTNDPTWKRLLKGTTVLFTNINPDGWEANTRGNATGTDINRDFMALETPESRVLAQVMRDWKPDILNDLHEFGPGKYYDTDALVLWPRNRMVDSEIHELSMTMVNDYTAPQIEASGYSTGIYGQLVKDGQPFRQIAGDEQGRILRNYTGLKHITGQLTETASGALNPQEQADPSLLNRRRVVSQYDSSIGSMWMMLENGAELAKQSAAAANRATKAGATRSGVIFFKGQDDMLPTTADGVESEPMCGYQLTREQLAENEAKMSVHGITWHKNATGAFVTMAQPNQPLIPQLFDARGPYHVTAATPLKTCP